MIEKIKKNTIRIVESLSILIILYIGYFTIQEDFFSENTSFYFFSALLQGNAAIISLLFIFLLHKLQSLQNQIDLTRENLTRIAVGISIWVEDIIKFDNYSINEKRTFLEERKNKIDSQQTLPLLTKWLQCEEETKKLKDKAKPFLCLLSLSIIIFALGIIFANSIHTNKCIWVESVCLFLGLIFEIFILFELIDKSFKIFNKNIE